MCEVARSQNVTSSSLHSFMISCIVVNNCVNVATLALGSRPRQGIARLWEEKEARESRQRHGKVASQKEGSPGANAKALEGCRPRGSPGVITYSREFKEVQGSVRE
jgi:hypothetical protein